MLFASTVPDVSQHEVGSSMMSVRMLKDGTTGVSVDSEVDQNSSCGFIALGII
jgi:hypothetical protein